MFERLVLASTTDTPEQVAAALAGDQPVPAAPPAAPTPTEPAPPVPPADATPKAAPAAEATPAADTATAAPEVPTEKKAEDEEPETEEPPQAQGARTRSKLQQRIDEITREKHEARGEAATLRRELEDLRAELAAKAQAETPQAPETPVKPKAEDFATYEEYVEAVADWKADQKVKTALAADAAARAQEAVSTAYRARLETARAAHTDFDTIAFRSDVEISPDVMAPFLLHSPLGPEIQYYLGQHPDESKALAQLRGPAGFVALGKLEARIEADMTKAKEPPAPPPASPVPPTPPPKPSIPSAPPPVTPVSGETSPALGSLDALPITEYIKRRNEDTRAREGRR